MQVFRDQEITDAIVHKPRGRVVSDMEFEKCRFWNCGFIGDYGPADRPVVRRLSFRNCSEKASWIFGPIIEDVMVDGLRTTGLLITFGAVFKHVILRGKIGQIKMNACFQVGPTGRHELERERAYQEANSQFYQQVDWALDISEAEFLECDIDGIPSHLIRRDPDTQVVIKRENAINVEWQRLNLEQTWWDLSINNLIEEGRDDRVLIAPKRHRKFKELVQGLRMLRDLGVAEPD